jgi:hypothetical protein
MMSGICVSALSSGSSGPAPPPPQGSFYYQHLFCRTNFISSWMQGGRHRRLQLRWWPLLNLPPAPPKGPTIDVSNTGGGHRRTCSQHPTGGPPSTSPTPVVAVVGPTTSTPRGPAIDVTNSGGGRYRTCRQQPLRGPPSTSPTPVVAAARPAASTPQGTCH